MKSEIEIVMKNGTTFLMHADKFEVNTYAGKLQGFKYSGATDIHFLYIDVDNVLAIVQHRSIDGKEVEQEGKR